MHGNKKKTQQQFVRELGKIKKMNFGSQDKMWKTNKKTLKTTSPISHRSMEVYKFYLTISHLKHGKLILKKTLAT